MKYIVHKCLTQTSLLNTYRAEMKVARVCNVVYGIMIELIRTISYAGIPIHIFIDTLRQNYFDFGRISGLVKGKIFAMQRLHKRQ